jgi:hypothetical protein
MKAMQEGFEEEFKSVKSALAKLDAVSKKRYRYTEIPQAGISVN